MNRYWFAAAMVLLSALLVHPAHGQEKAAPPFELKDGDRVLFVGATFIEREGQLGYIETAMIERFRSVNVTFRNLGQAGDTAFADARNLNSGWAAFGPPDQGFNRLKKLTEEIRPTVIIANYGMTESFEGPARLDGFIRAYDKLLGMLVDSAGGSPRVVLISPNYHEDLGKPYPDPKEHNENLKLYTAAIRDLAGKKQARFVDLFSLTEKLSKEIAPARLTDNGIHLTEQGYKLLAYRLLNEMGIPASNQPAVDFEKLRKLVVAKNFDYFNYWRPQNDTYILGYRKKEQGRNAVEMPQFLPLVEAKEKEIAAVKK